MSRIIANLLTGWGSGSVPAAPDVPTFSVADNGDGTGGVVTIAGSTVGSTNTFFAAPWSGGFISAAFVSYGSRTGNGTLAVALVSGYYWGLVRSSLSGQIVDSLPVGFRISSGDQAVYYRCLEAVAARLATLGLGGIAGSSIVIRKTPWNRNLATPGIFVTPSSEVPIEPATNARDDIGYGVQLTVVRASNQDVSANLAAELSWREQISRAFRESALAGVDEIYTVRFEPGPVIDAASFAAQYDVQTLVLRCVARETRGT